MNKRTKEISVYISHHLLKNTECNEITHVPFPGPKEEEEEEEEWCRNRESIKKIRKLMWFNGFNLYLVATFYQMLGHPGRRRGCSVRQAQGPGCPGHSAERSAALLLSTLFGLSMPVPGQPSPLDLHKARKHMHKEAITRPVKL